VGKYITIELSGENQKSIYIPRGCAHGFRVVDEAAIVYYLVTSEYAPEHDKGIRYDSFGYDWKVTNPIVSERDLQFPRLAEYGGIFR
jgi:dTDP-4-dehydrorhamnose 3,5-epimerase/CDP-3, 6-dideoxy-D-glycero-D-glycero-4-hexulose-5-epimerase